MAKAEPKTMQFTDKLCPVFSAIEKKDMKCVLESCAWYDMRLKVCKIATKI